MNRITWISLAFTVLGVGLAARAADAPAAHSGAARARALGADDARLAWGACPPLFPPGCQIAILQGDPSKPNADVFFRIPGGYAIPPHSHTSAEHLVLVAGELDVHYKGRPAMTMKAGEYAYGPPGLPHLGHCRSATPCTLFIAFELPVDATAYDGAIP
jgi:quercetin dioxygenase-like cupin family protein